MRPTARVFFQNANHSVRVTDAFMQAVVDDGEWTTHAVVGGEPMDTYQARDIFRKMADAAHLCGDPGIQYDTTINDWHTSAEHGPHPRVATRAPSTCSSTTPPATWPASTS